MASKKSLLGGVTLKVENMSGFDKSRLHAFTAPLGAIVPMCKQLLLPGKMKCSVTLSAQLPPLASDAFLRTHLKVEAFFVPLRICYGGFASWFSGEKISTSVSGLPNAALTTAALPRLKVYGAEVDSSGTNYPTTPVTRKAVFGPHTLMDYFGVKHLLGTESGIEGVPTVPWADPSISGYLNYSYYNIFPFIGYQLCYHHWYRNKLIERPLFAPPAHSSSGGPTTYPSALPYVSKGAIVDFNVHMNNARTGSTYGFLDVFNDVALLNGHLLELRQRNYGFDYFTTSLPSAQDGNPMTVDTSAGNFTISSLRIANAAQHFAEINQISGPDYIQTLRARYNRAPSSAIASKPVLLGSADFPMFTSGVEQTAPFDTGSQQTGNPFEGLGARYGRAHAEGSDFVCECDVDEPGYLFVMCSLVPEANYAVGTAHEMRIFTGYGDINHLGSLVDLPCAELERCGLEPVYSEEVSPDDSGTSSGLFGRAIFGYQPRYMWHKAGAQNMISGLFRQGCSLESFIPQRLGVNGVWQTRINSAFLKVNPTDLDNVTAVSGAISQYGVMVDSSIRLYVSEPLGESALPSLVDPAAEHGQSVYVSRGGISVND